MSEPAWRERASCGGQDPNRFVPNTELEPPPPWVVQLCGGCEVRAECLAEAMRFRSVGYWGGLSTRQRRGQRRSSSAS